MCGIMGYVGTRSAKNSIYAGLQRLEYRGYDSSGIALLSNDKFIVTKSVGDTSRLDMDSLPAEPTLGIGHTRWATHGKPSVVNAHPHIFGSVALVHNGVIENYEELKSFIDARSLKSQTDSEVLAALIDSFIKQSNSLLEATKKALALVRGTYGVAVMVCTQPDQIVVARRGSPIVIGVDDTQHYVASDSSAIIDHTNKVVYLKDNQIAVVRADSLDLFDLKLNQQSASVETLESTSESLEMGAFKSFLEKEIHEQPAALRNVMRGRVGEDGTIVLGGPNLTMQDLQSLRRILIIGCGTAYYAGCYARYELEKLLKIPVSVEHASEFRHRHGAFDNSSSAGNARSS